MRSRSVSLLVVAVAVTVAATAACGSDGPVTGSSDTTTGTVDRLSTTTAPDPSDPQDPGGSQAPGPGGADPGGADPGSEVPGLWLASPVGITDEQAAVYATPAPGESLRDPVDDGEGGVFYLRCTDPAPTCAIEHATAPDGTPTAIGTADDLLALGTREGRRVLVTSWTDVDRVPSAEQDAGSRVGRLVDVDDQRIEGPYEWFGWERRPFVADVEEDRLVMCVGVAATCRFSRLTAPEAPPVPITGIAEGSVVSAVLDVEGVQLAWLERPGGSGGVVAHRRHLQGTEATEVTLREASDPPVDEAVTDGVWAALRTAGTVELWPLQADGPAGAEAVEQAVPADVTQMAIKSTGGGGGGTSPL